MADDLFTRSRYALLTGDLIQAETLCLQLIKRQPNNTSAQLLLGSIYIKEGKLQSAQKVFETLIQSEKNNADAWINAAVVYQKRGKLQTALKAAQMADKLAGNRADIIFNIGNIHRQLGELTKAEAIYNLVIQKHSDFISSYNNLALLLCDAGRVNEAEEVLKRGLLIDQNNPGLHFNLANLYSAREEYDNAAAEYRIALKINPGWEECLLNLGNILRKKQPEEAARMYQKVMDLSPESTDAKCKLGEIVFDRGDIEEAEIIFTKILTKTPLYTPAAVNLAAVYYAKKQLPKAEKLLREYQEKDSENLELRLLLSNILLETGKYNEAFTNIRFVLDRNQNESRAWFAMARQFSLSGKKDKALNTYRKGLHISPDSHEARLQLALLLKGLNKIDGAIKECEYIYKKSPDDFAPALLLAELYIEKQLYSKAAKILETLSHDNPDDIKLLQMYAETAKQAGFTEKALQAAEKLAAARNDIEDDFDLDALNENLKLYDEMAVEYANEYGNRWTKNLKTLAGIIDEKPQIQEEGSYLFDGLQDIAGEYVPILDVGGIDPVILFDEDEEILTLTEEDEYIPPPEEDEEEPEEEIIAIPAGTAQPASESSTQPEAESSAQGQAQGTAEQPEAIPPNPPPLAPSINFSNPLTIKLETAPFVVQQIPPPPPKPEADAEPEAEAPVEEEEFIEPVDPDAAQTEDEDNLFGYLDKLTRFLPGDKRSEYINSDIRLKLAALKMKMDGDPGLISRIQNSRSEESVISDAKPIKLTKTTIGNTLNFMTGLTGALPDSKIAESLGDKLKDILSRLNSEKEKVDD